MGNMFVAFNVNKRVLIIFTYRILEQIPIYTAMHIKRFKLCIFYRLYLFFLVQLFSLSFLIFAEKNYKCIKTLTKKLVI